MPPNCPSTQRQAAHIYVDDDGPALLGADARHHGTKDAPKYQKSFRSRVISKRTDSDCTCLWQTLYAITIVTELDRGWLRRAHRDNADLLSRCMARSHTRTPAHSLF